MPSDPDLATHLADNVKRLRELRGLTQNALATVSEMPRSTIANLETGSANPTLAVLAQVARTLQVSLEELLSPPRGRIELFRRDTLPVERKGRGGTVVVHKLLPHPIPGMEIDRIELKPQAVMPGVPHSPGTHEYLYVAQGAITLWVAGEKLGVARGDVASFPGDQRHSYRNDGRVAAIGFSVVTLKPV